MSTERRLENQRMVIEKHVEIRSLDNAAIHHGTTQDMSDSGIGAHFESPPQTGSKVMLRLFWKENSDPIEQPASLIWASPSDSTGLVRVGLKLEDISRERCPSEHLENHEQNQLTEDGHYLEEGCPVLLNTGGVAIDTIVSAIGPMSEDNTVQVVLKITDTAFTGLSDQNKTGSLPPEEQDWSPHPFRDAWQTIHKYAGPTIKLTIRYIAIVFHLVAVASRWLWQKCPNKMRSRASTLSNRTLGSPRQKAAKTLVIGLIFRVKQKLTSVRLKKDNRSQGTKR